MFRGNINIFHPFGIQPKRENLWSPGPRCFELLGSQTGPTFFIENYVLVNRDPYISGFIIIIILIQYTSPKGFHPQKNTKEPIYTFFYYHCSIATPKFYSQKIWKYYYSKKMIVPNVGWEKKTAKKKVQLVNTYCLNCGLGLPGKRFLNVSLIGHPKGSWEYISNHVLLRFFWDKPRQVYTLKRPPWDTLSSLPFSLKIMPTERPFPRHKQYLTFWFTKWRSLKHLKAQKGPPWGSKQGHDLTGLIRIKRYLLNAKSFLGKMRSERQTVMWCFLFEGWIPDTQKPLDTGQCWSQFHTDSGDWLPQNRLEAGKGPGKWEWILRYTWKINMEYKHGGLEDGFPLQFGDF